MDANRFDNWTRNRALRLSRRNALRLMGASGVAAALPNSSSPALAQSSCSLTIHAETAGGPSAPVTYDGVLQFTLGSDGSFTQASFAPSSGGSQPAFGFAIGRAVDMQITLAQGQTLALSGAGEQPIANCQGAASGIVSGPQPGDLGAWQAVSGAGSGSSSGSTAPPASGQSGSGSSGSSSSSGGNCLELQSQCNAGTECCSGWCTDNECRTCGDTICGEDCAVLSDNLAHCGACFNPCDTDTESCVNGVCTTGNGGGATCLPDGVPCLSSTDCCSGGCTLQTKVCGCAQLGQSCSDDDMYCCEGTPVVCFGACCIIDGFACSADADCCDYIQARGFCTNGICTRNA